MEVALEEDTQRGKYLTFALGQESYGLEINCIKEIVGMQPVTSIPEAPPWMRGIINLRGRIIPVIDMRLKFGKPEKAYDDRTCIVVIDAQETLAGLIVDTVAEVLAIGEDNIVPPPSLRSGAGNRVIKAIGKVGSEVKLLLDSEKLFQPEELENLENMI